MELKLERILVEFGGAIVAIFAAAEVVKYSIGIILVKYVADIIFPLLESYKVIYGLADLAYLLALILLVLLTVISIIVGVFGYKLYSTGSKLSRENAEKWLIRTLLIATVSLICGAFIVSVASGIALLGVLIALARKEG